MTTERIVAIAAAGLALAGMGAFGGKPPLQVTRLEPVVWTSRGLDSLVARVAAYPDPLLDEVLAACMYPRQIAAASRWLKQNASMGGADLLDAARQYPWDASVAALVVFPDVLARLDADIAWTTEMGQAFRDHRSEVLEAVERTRARVRASGAGKAIQTSPNEPNLRPVAGAKGLIIKHINPVAGGGSGRIEFDALASRGSRTRPVFRGFDSAIGNFMAGGFRPTGRVR